MRFDWLNDGVYVVGIPIIVLLVVSIVRRVRAIRDLDARLRREEIQNPTDPYAALAQLYAEKDKR